jgi:hypothetical protein
MWEAKGTGAMTSPQPRDDSWDIKRHGTLRVISELSRIAAEMTLELMALPHRALITGRRMPLFHVQYRNQRTFSNRCGDKLIQHSASTARANSGTPCFTCKSRCASHPKMLHAVLVVHLHLWFRFFYHKAVTSDRPESVRLAATGIEARNGPANGYRPANTQRIGDDF